MVAGITQARHRIEGLDVLRGLAILLVLIRHSWPEFLGGGGLVGVVVFFTLSGYLITGLLVADIRNYGKVRYGRFYRNRAVRLIPALLFVLVAFVILEGVLDVRGTRDSVGQSVLVALTYTMNVPGLDHGSGSLSHLWTLANEEQFYVVWPVVLAFGLRFRRLRLVVALTVVVMFVLLMGTIGIMSPLEKLYTWPTTWTISMVIGAAAQLGKDRISRWLSGQRATVGALTGTLGLLGLSCVPDAKETLWVYLFGGALIGAFTVLVIWKLRQIPVVPLPLKPLLWLGTISYAAYLWNYPLSIWLRVAFPSDWQILTVVLTVVLATMSWYCVEQPFNRLKRHLDRRTHSSRLDPVRAAG